MPQVKKEYDLLLESGDLEMLFPKASGVWETDKKQFTLIYEENQKFLNNFEVKYATVKKGSS